MQISRASSIIAAHARLNETLAPTIGDAGFNLSMGLQTDSQAADAKSVAKNLSGLANRDVPTMQALRAESNTLLGVLTEVSYVVSPETFAPLRDRFIASVARARKDLDSLVDSDQAAKLRSALDAMADLAGADRGIFDARRRELGAVADGLRLCAACQADGAKFAIEIDQFVQTAEASATNAISGANSVISRSKAMLFGGDRLERHHRVYRRNLYFSPEFLAACDASTRRSSNWPTAILPSRCRTRGGTN